MYPSTDFFSINTILGSGSNSNITARHKQLDYQLGQTLTVLPGGMRTVMDQEENIIFARYPSGMELRRNHKLVVVRSTDTLDHWVATAGGPWCRWD